jgi:hypothetical protein
LKQNAKISSKTKVVVFTLLARVEFVVLLIHRLEFELSRPNQDAPLLLRQLFDEKSSFINDNFESSITTCTTCFSCRRTSRYQAPGMKCISLHVASTIDRLTSAANQSTIAVEPPQLRPQVSR